MHDVWICLSLWGEFLSGHKNFSEKVNYLRSKFISLLKLHL